jgi:hypothetical protein
VAADQHPDRTTFNGVEIKLRRGVAHGNTFLNRPYRHNTTQP